ncbi:MAG TPA: hypothetical protein IAA98_02445 [Candidatus Avipropionibacterium avicola]|uniref:Uncharacterized protein n=1 Tax=Candidatus Avipropionibacterium avicola TaxID=2840701 RepID=A0A9D1GXQ9_9ACTN|nr:hypothetical protein [Candidatus Avipropionibacterium avicola]
MGEPQPDQHRDGDIARRDPDADRDRADEERGDPGQQGPAQPTEAEHHQTDGEQGRRRDGAQQQGTDQGAQPVAHHGQREGEPGRGGAESQLGLDLRQHR